MQQTPTAVRSTNAVYVEMRLQAILCSPTMFYLLVWDTKKKSRMAHEKVPGQPFLHFISQGL